MSDQTADSFMSRQSQAWNSGRLLFLSALYSLLVSCYVAIAFLAKKALVFFRWGCERDLVERTGRRIPPFLGKGTRFIINAVSVGEVTEAETLVHALAKIIPDLQVLITTGNRAGRERAELMANPPGSQIQVQYLPWDSRENIRRWLNEFQPAALIAIETEIWPNLFRSCRELDIPVFIVNGRIYAKDVRRYRWVKGFFADVLACVDWIGVQSMADFKRFVSIGADPSSMEVMGNLKLVRNPILPRPSNVRLHALIRSGGELLVGGSTHAPEEKWIVESFAYLRKTGRTTRLILAPRNVTRSVSLVDFARSRGFRVVRWSTATELNDSWDILVLDQVGWLTAMYSLRPLVIMGGTFARKGGHNIAEAAAYACPVLVGPEVWNFQEMVEEFHREGGIVKTDRRHLTADIIRLLDNGEERDRIGERGQGVLRSHAGCSDSYAASIIARLGIEDPGTQVQEDGNRVTALVAQANARSLRRRLASNRVSY